MRILIAPNAFKNSLDAEASAYAIRDGFIRSKLVCECECFPIGDGGDGTGNLIVKRFQGIRVPVMVHDPLGRVIESSFGLIENGKTAVVEMADASGLRLLKPKELDPMVASSFGTGELIKAALDHGIERIIIGLGGSATVDGGSGIISALGVRLLNERGNGVVNMPKNLIKIDRIDLSEIDKRILSCEVIVMCDVENTLLGTRGAAHVFGPQKGATLEDVVKLDAGLSHFAGVAETEIKRNISEVKHSGAAGGAAAGLFGFLNAKLVNGIDYFLELTSFKNSLQSASLVITGEGSIDKQTLNGKGPSGVASLAKRSKKMVIGLAGLVPLHPDEDLHKYFDSLVAIGNGPMTMDEAIQSTRENLERTAFEIGNILAAFQNN